MFFLHRKYCQDKTQHSKAAIGMLCAVLPTEKTLSLKHYKDVAQS